jgi:hypothetical protein
MVGFVISGAEHTCSLGSVFYSLYCELVNGDMYSSCRDVGALM